MYGDPVAIFFQSVKPAFRAYVAARDEGVSGSNSHLASATKAASELFHFREHMPDNVTKTRSQVENECFEYRLIADVANASKHRKIDRNNPLLAEASDVYEICVITRYADSKGEYTDARTTIRVNCTDGLTRNLDKALVIVYNYWISQLAKLNLAHEQPLPAYIEPSTNFVSRADAKSGAYNVMKEVGWKQLMQLMIFDNDAGRASPMNLTGCDIKLNVYEPPPLILDMFLNADQLTAPLKASVELTTDETTEYWSLRTQPEHEAFRERISEKYKDTVNQQFNSQLEALGFYARLR